MALSLIRIGYIAAFGLSALACFASLPRTRLLDDTATKRGLTALLLTSGLWATAHVGRITAATPALKIAFYLIGLTVGLASIGAWLYFCSAYTGHDYHHRPRIRQLALAVYLALVAVKLTNPLHHQYFTTSFATTPFPHLVIHQLTLHWVVTGIAYALSAIGFYLLYELFSDSHYTTTSLGLLVALTGLPALLDVVGYTHPAILIELNYEPIGVALFAVGVLYFVEEKFVAVPTFGPRQVIETLEEPILLLDREDILRDYNAAAAAQFPDLDGGLGTPLDELAPQLVAATDSDDLFTMAADEDNRVEDTRYYLCEATPLTVGSMTIGRALVVTDVTDLERHRQELHRQNEQLDDFAEAITHELRNTLNIIRGHLTEVGTILATDASPAAEQSLASATEAVTRMSRIIDDLSLLAEHGQTLDEFNECDLGDVANRAWEAIETTGLTLTVETTGRVAADAGRLEALFQDAFEFARVTDATEVVVAMQADGFTITTDGVGISSETAEQAFEYGAAVPTAKAGMALPNVRALARVHGWTVSLDTQYQDGVRLVISDVDVIDT